MIGWFRVLVGSDKLEIIGLYLLVIIPAIAWARFIAKRHDAKWPSSLASYLGNQGIKNCKNDSNSTQECDNQHKPKKDSIVWLQLLRKCCYNLRLNLPYCHTHKERDDQKQPSNQCQAKNFHWSRIFLMFPVSHIRTIVNKLRRRVNHSGTEPPIQGGISRGKGGECP